MNRITVTGPCWVVETTYPNGEVYGGHFQFEYLMKEFLAEHPRRYPEATIKRWLPEGRTMTYIKRGKLTLQTPEGIWVDLKRIGSDE